MVDYNRSNMRAGHKKLCSPLIEFFMAPRLKKILQQSLTSKEGEFLNWGALGVGMAHFMMSVVHFLKISSMLN